MEVAAGPDMEVVAAAVEAEEEVAGAAAEVGLDMGQVVALVMVLGMGLDMAAIRTPMSRELAARLL